jgi:hypothetical protein
VLTDPIIRTIIAMIIEAKKSLKRLSTSTRLQGAIFQKDVIFNDRVIIIPELALQLISITYNEVDIFTPLSD